MIYEVKTIEHIAKAERHAFYPNKKYVGIVLRDSREIYRTGYCSKRSAAFNRAAAEMAKLRDQQSAVAVSVDQLFLNGGRMF